MDLELSADQHDLALLAKELLDQRAPLSLARGLLEGRGDPRELWREIAEGGWYAIGLEEGDPFGVPGLCLLARECGAHAAPTPLVDTAVAARLASMLSDHALRDSLLAGELTVALGVLEERADWSLRGLSTTVAPVGAGYLVNGTKIDVHHGEAVDLLMILAALGDEVGAFFIPREGAGVTIEATRDLDPSARSTRVTLKDVSVSAGSAVTGLAIRPLLERALAVGAVTTAAEGVGAASRALDMAIEYALERRQFGRPIGQFQALQHLLADAHVLRETAWSAVLYAGSALSEGTSDALEAAAIAKAHSARASRSVVEASLQVFGGIAFTWEHDVHLLQRRVLGCERRFGDAIHHERLLGDRLASAVGASR